MAPEKIFLMVNSMNKALYISTQAPNNVDRFEWLKNAITVGHLPSINKMGKPTGFLEDVIVEYSLSSLFKRDVIVPSIPEREASNDASQEGCCPSSETFSG
jgi:hypothetical protein